GRRGDGEQVPGLKAVHLLLELGGHGPASALGAGLRVATGALGPHRDTRRGPPGQDTARERSGPVAPASSPTEGWKIARAPLTPYLPIGRIPVAHTPRRRRPLPKRTSLADALRRAIKESGQTVLAIANGAGIPNPVLYRFVNGQRDLTLRTASKLMDHLGLT